MRIEPVTPDKLRAIARDVGELNGWDFSGVRDDRDPVPWDYQDIVRRYLRPGSRVLDIGTGGGEQFLQLAPLIGTAACIDASAGMVATARARMPSGLAGKVSFSVMDAERLGLPDASFDLVLNRHAPVYAAEIVRVLRPGGICITQQVGGRNTQSIFAAFGWQSNAAHWQAYFAAPGAPAVPDSVRGLTALAAAFGAAGCGTRALAEYDVRYWLSDLDSFVFFIKAIPLPEQFDPDVHCAAVNRVISACGSPRGIQTNEHRYLLIVEKSAGGSALPAGGSALVRRPER
jgi:SAM-dependent methyltransferase